MLSTPSGSKPSVLQAVEKRLHQTLRNSSDSRQLRANRGEPKPQEVAKFFEKQVRRLLKDPSWLEGRYQQARENKVTVYKILIDPRYSLFSLVWPQGQALPPHDHWVAGAIGIVQGVETEQKLYFNRSKNQYVPKDAPYQHHAGDISLVWPDDPDSPIDATDWHTVRNDHAQTAVSLHLYNADYTVFKRSHFVDGHFEEYVSNPVDLEKEKAPV